MVCRLTTCFVMWGELDELNDYLGFGWVADQKDSLCTFEYRVLFPNQLIGLYDLHGILRHRGRHSKTDCQPNYSNYS